MNAHFSASSTTPIDSSTFENLGDDSWFPSFDVLDVWQHLHRLPCKATGSDNIPNLLYKRAALVLAEPLHNIFTECFRQRRFPSVWKISDVVAIPKTKVRSLDDFRPISLLPIPAKLCEKLILDSVRSAITSTLGRNQFGIRRNSSTTHAIIAVHDTMTKHADDLEVGASVLIAFDFSKAFDRIDHRQLISRAQDSNLPLGFVRLLADYLRGRQQ
jgi:hypothetical protein